MTATGDPRALLARLIRQIAPEADLGSIDPTASLQEELDLDSMDFLRLMALLLAETGIDVPERDYPQLNSVAGFIEYVTAR
jgi:acyl carrier protein